MASWNFAGYNNGRGASVTFTYTASYNALTNQTTITITNYTSVFNTGGVSGYCSLSGTLTVKAADNTSSYGTLVASHSKSGNGPTVSTDVSQTITVSHGTGTSKQVILSFNGDINAVTWHTYPTDSTTYTTVTVASATARTLSITTGTGSSITVTRQSSPWAATGNIANGATVYDGDVLKITFSANTGYDLGTHTVNGSTFTSGNTHTVSANVSVVSSATVKSFTLSITTETGATLTVNRTSSPKKGAATGVLSNGAAVYYSDVLKITFSANAGYEIAVTLNASAISSGVSHTVTGAVVIIASAKVLGAVYIDNSSSMDMYLIFLDNGNEWEQLIPQVDNGSGWDVIG